MDWCNQMSPNTVLLKLQHGSQNVYITLKTVVKLGNVGFSAMRENKVAKSLRFTIAGGSLLANYFSFIFLWSELYPRIAVTLYTYILQQIVLVITLVGTFW